MPRGVGWKCPRMRDEHDQMCGLKTPRVERVQGVLLPNLLIHGVAISTTKNHRCDICVTFVKRLTNVTSIVFFLLEAARDFWSFVFSQRWRHVFQAPSFGAFQELLGRARREERADVQAGQGLESNRMAHWRLHFGAGGGRARHRVLTFALFFSSPGGTCSTLFGWGVCNIRVPFRLVQ